LEFNGVVPAQEIDCAEAVNLECPKGFKIATRREAPSPP